MALECAEKARSWRRRRYLGLDIISYDSIMTQVIFHQSKALSLLALGLIQCVSHRLCVNPETSLLADHSYLLSFCNRQ